MAGPVIKQQWLVKRPGAGGGGTAGPEISYSIPYAATITPNCDNGTLQICRLSGNVTVAAATNRNDHRLHLVLVQDATGGRIITFDPSWRVPPEVQPYGFPGTYTTISVFFDAAGVAWHISYPITGMITS